MLSNLHLINFTRFYPFSSPTKGVTFFGIHIEGTMPENPLEHYLTEIGEIRGTRSNAPETSFYPAMERLLTAIGKSLSPKVRCVINLANRGAGLPDGGLFSADQFRRKNLDSEAKGNPFQSQNPSRGVIEAKSPAEDISRAAGTEQVERYWKRYGMVLVTNFRAFTLIGMVNQNIYTWPNPK